MSEWIFLSFLIAGPDWINVPFPILILVQGDDDDDE